jgi:hypothetical protein
VNCVEVRRRLGRYLSSTLPQREVEAFSHHLKECSACRKELKLMQNIGVLISRQEPVPPPPSLESEFLEKLQRVSPSWPWYTRFWEIREKPLFRAYRWGTVLALGLALLSLLLPRSQQREVISKAVIPKPALQTLIAWHKWSDQQGPVADVMTDLTLHTLAHRDWPSQGGGDGYFAGGFSRVGLTNLPLGGLQSSGPSPLLWVSQR